MSHVVIGTAGHIDHGKTTLIKALTGIETDRLKEEIQRGITIDLGFAWFDLPDGRRAGIVDVPGHERFIKNMLAGVSGIDIVLLIVSADEGIMPQTREHLDILTLLKIQKGIVVLTKADLVDPDWLEMVREELKESLKGTFLESAPIMPVSAVQGTGLEELKAQINQMTLEAPEHNLMAPFRLPVDRVFSVTGFGTVVTGTLVEGVVKEGDLVTLYPSGQETRVRKIQVHGVSVSEAKAGQRVAVNLANLKKTDVHRGDVLAPPDSLRDSWMLDCQMELLPHEARTLQNWTRLRLYHGTREVLCRLVLLDREELLPGETAAVQLRLEEPLACKYMDRFVLRFYSPLETIGGGVILDPAPPKHKRFKDGILKELEQKLAGDPMQLLETALLKQSPEMPDKGVLQTLSGLDALQTDQLLERMVSEQLAYYFDGVYLHRDYLNLLANDMASILEGWHRKYPLRVGMPKEEIRSRLLKGVKGKLFDALLKFFSDDGVIKVLEKDISLGAFEVRLSAEQRRIADQLVELYLKSEYKSPSQEEAFQQVGAENDSELFMHLIQTGILFPLADGIVYHKDCYQKAVEVVKSVGQELGVFSMGDLREKIDISRKYAIPLLEHLDAIRMTRREGDGRVLR